MDIWEIIALAKAGGGGGTSDYSALSNKPSINGVTLSGNKTGSDLGLAGDLVDEAVSGTTPSIIAEAGKRYICGEVSTLSFTPPVNGVAVVRFTSGSTATDLTLGPTVVMPTWYPEELDTNTVYQIMVEDGVYGTVTQWPA